MAIKQLVVDGNVNDPTSWNGGTLPLSGDTCETNGFTGTIDSDFECAEMNNNGGGKYIVTSDATITANITVSTGGGVLDISSGVNVILIGDIIHQANNINNLCVIMQSSSTLMLLGDITLNGLNWQNQNSLYLYGNCSATIMGDVINNSSSTGSGGTVRGVIYLIGSGNNLIVIGDVKSTSTSTNDKIITIQSSNSYIEVQGVVLSAQAPAIVIPSIYNNNNISVNNVIAGNTPAIMERQVVENGTTNILTINGTITDNIQHNAIFGFKKIIGDTFNQWEMIDPTNSVKILYPVNNGVLGQAAESDVRKDVVYGPSSELTGELEPVIVDVSQLASDLLDEIQTSTHSVAQRLRRTSTDETVASIVTSSISVS